MSLLGWLFESKAQKKWREDSEARVRHEEEQFRSNQQPPTVVNVKAPPPEEGKFMKGFK